MGLAMRRSTQQWQQQLWQWECTLQWPPTYGQQGHTPSNPPTLTLTPIMSASQKGPDSGEVAAQLCCMWQRWQAGRLAGRQACVDSIILMV